MSAPSLRSRSGCFACKRRRKKCDESKPTCIRCAKSGLECRYIRPAEETKLRTKTQFIYESPMMAGPPVSINQPLMSRSVAARSLPSPPTALDHFLYPNTDTSTADDLYFPFVPPSHPLDFSLPSDDTWHPALVQPTSFRPRPTGQTLDHVHPVQVADQLASVLSPHTEFNPSYPSPSQSQASRSVSDVSTTTTSMTAGQASLFQALLSLARPEDKLVLSAFGNPAGDMQSSGLPSPRSSRDSAESVASEEEEHELEEVERDLCIAPTLARNAESNTLAFVLQSYARWFASTVYDPLRIAQLAKHNIMRQVTSSEPTRTRVILVANAFRMLGSTLDLNARGASLLTMLRTEVHQDLALFNSQLPVMDRESDMAAALKMLENILEVVSVHFYTSPLPIVLALLQATAPVFRRSCPEPPEQLVNLPRMLIEPGLYRRYFAIMDVGLSVVTDRPQLFRYDVSYTADVRERMIKLDYTADYGLEWLYGIPDRFILLFAWINGLREDYYGREVDPDIILRVEEQIRNERVGQNLHTASDSDPVFRIRRLVVQEVWRQVVYIFLYMALCGADASDPRVEKAFSLMMRLIRETKPARNPDAFLFIPMLAAGVAARSEKDRVLFKRRMLAVRECSVPGIVGNGGVYVLQDIWERTDAEGRPAIWADFIQLPGPPPAGWIKGHFSSLVGSGSVAFQEKIIAEYGPTLKLNGGFGEEFIFTTDPAAMYSVLVKERVKFERPFGSLLLLRSVFGGGLLAQSGDEHRIHRKLLNPVFTMKFLRESNWLMLVVMPIFMGIAKQTCEGIKKDLKLSKSSSKEVDVFPWATVAALELVGEAGLGYSFSSFTGERNEYNIAIKSVMQVFSKMGPFMKVLPLVYHIGTPSLRRWMLKHIPHRDIQQLRYAVGIQNQQAEEVIRTRQALISSGDDLSSQAGRGRDIMTLLMKANETAGSESYVDHQDMVGHMNTAVARILDILADRPRVQVRLREEIREYFENNPNDTHYDGLLELPYLDAVVREVLRLHGPVSFINRICEEDTILPLQFPVDTPSGKVTSIPIKKGTRVFMSVSVSNRFGGIWGERAHEFVPERWIGSKIDEVTQPGAQLPGVYSSMMTFGAGSRACIGFKFAIMEIKVMIAELVKDFKFEPSQEEHNWEFPYIKKDLNDPARVPKLPLRVVQV
ncbi:unnamed protein product [Rhizoctonia solani]|uniref:Zn(2)-C6 fungal-type domain-containing protein n=1 Tax=Rhizoctonia solani TaxID=456999 RepID=A0A8H3CPB2_9AGAM|nr:unnamed protein product [Rhizoctonia solani]